MKRFAAVLLAVAGSACLQAAPAPLTPTADTSLDPAMVGVWRCVTDNEDTAARLTISEPRPKVYRLQFDIPGDDPAVFEGHPSLVGSTVVLNVQETGEENPHGWYFAVPALLKKDVLDLRYVAIEELTPEPREQVKAALASGAQLQQACACVPAKSE